MKALKYVSLFVVLAMLITACAAPAPTATPVPPTKAPAAAAPTAAPAPTKAPEPTKAPAAEPTKAAAAPTAAPTAAAAAVNLTPPGACTLKTPPAQQASIAYLSNKFSVLEYYANALDQCGKNPANNVKIQTDWLPSNERLQKANLVLSSGDTAYEIIHATTNNMVDFASAGWLLPLDDLIAKYKDQYKLGDIPEAVWAKMRVNGKIYGIPNSGNAQIFFYRKDIYEKYNLKPPKTWAEAEEQFKLLAEKKDTPYVFAATWAKGSDLAGEFGRSLLTKGGAWFEGGAANPKFNDAKAVELGEWMKGLLKYMPADVLTYNNDKVMIALQQGQVASAITWVTRAKQMDDPTQSKVIGLINFAAVPSFGDGPTGTSVGFDTFVIPAKTDVPADVIFQVLMEATNQERQAGAADLAIMPRAAVANDPAIVQRNRYLVAINDAVARGMYNQLPTMVPYYGIASRAAGNYLADALAGTSTVKQALDTAAKDYLAQAKEQGFIK
jgi:ABC-type glycerol-3-phosphate transport system substrate-binding protein